MRTCTPWRHQVFFGISDGDDAIGITKHVNLAPFSNMGGDMTIWINITLL